MSQTTSRTTARKAAVRKTAPAKAAQPAARRAAPKAVPKAAKAAAPKAVEKPAAKPDKVTKPAKPPRPAAGSKPDKPAKPKLVRDSFTIPKAEYAVIDALKQRAASLVRSVKKSELLRAGIKALAAMDEAAFLAAVKAVPPIKTGRPKGKKSDAMPAS